MSNYFLESSEKLHHALLMTHLPTAGRDFKRGLQRFLDFFKNLFWFSQYLEKRFIQKEFNWGQSHNDVTYFTLFG
jgi:hypothetical protein